jgi:hypothetical protein
VYSSVVTNHSRDSTVTTGAAFEDRRACSASDETTTRPTQSLSRSLASWGTFARSPRLGWDVWGNESWPDQARRSAPAPESSAPEERRRLGLSWRRVAEKKVVLIITNPPAPCGHRTPHGKWRRWHSHKPVNEEAAPVSRLRRIRSLIGYIARHNEDPPHFQPFAGQDDYCKPIKFNVVSVSDKVAALRERARLD